MNILLTTFGLLLVFVLFCTAQWRAATDMVFMDIVSTETFAACRNNALGLVNDRSEEKYKKLAPKKAPTNSKAIANKIDSTKAAETTALLEEEEEDPPEVDEREDEAEEKNQKQQKKQDCTSMLHIGALIKQDDININEGKGRAIFQLLHNLVTEMYKNEKFFIKAQEKDGDFVNQLLLNQIDKAKETQGTRKLGKAKDLATVNLDDKEQSYVRYKMFKGTKTSRKNKQTQDEAGYYPLLEFISLRNRTGNTIMSVWLAKRPLLMALFQDEKIVDEVIECRREIYNDIRKRKAAGMSGIDATNSKELENRFGTLIPDNLRQYIDFSTSSTKLPPK